MRVDYTDPVKRKLLLTAIHTTINDIVASDIQELQDEELVGSKLVNAIGEVLDYLDKNLTIEFND